MKVKTRKQNDSLIITLPSEYNIKENTEYTPMIDENGVISFVPVVKNIFAEHPEYDVKKALKAMNIGQSVGKENVR